MFEKIVFKRVESFIAQKNLVTSSQYGFPQGTIYPADRYCECNTNQYEKPIILMRDLYWSEIKAFDIVDHEILLHKLNHYGFCGIINIWFSSYLQGRTQTTQIGPNISERFDSTCGVPQGSDLGPLLFLLYIKDIQESSDKLFFCYISIIYRFIR